MSDSEQAHLKVIGRCIKRRQKLRPADVVDHIRVDNPAWADAIQTRMKAAGYGSQPQQAEAKKSRLATRRVSFPIREFWAIVADELAAAQGITPQAFMAAILSAGLYEAFLEVEAQRRALERAARPPPPPVTYPDDIDDQIPF